MPNVTNI
jgi:hypothetical protein